MSRRAPVYLGHDISHPPIARVTSMHTRTRGGMTELVATVRFPPEGISARSDEVFRLVQSGFWSSVSIGFDPLEQPYANAHGGKHWPRVNIRELSFVGMGANAGALVSLAAESPAMTKWLTRDLDEPTLTVIEPDVDVFVLHEPDPVDLFATITPSEICAAAMSATTVALETALDHIHVQRTGRLRG